MPEVLVDRIGTDVVRLTLNRPDRLNALTAGLVTELHTALEALERDRSCRVVVLTGAGQGFCAGLDLGGYGTATGEPDSGLVQSTLSMQRHIASVMQRIRRLPQPVIAAVNGAAAGGGLALVCASDIRIAAENAVFASSFIRVGFSGCDMGVSWVLPRLVGAGRAHELMLTGRRFTADEALRIGLLADVVPADDLEARVERLCAQLLDAAPLSLSLTKQAMWLGLEIASFDSVVELENRQQVLTALTEDQTEAQNAFVQKRSPSYQDR